MQISGVKIAQHTAKSRPWTTSRLDYILKEDGPKTTVKPVENEKLNVETPDWHPLTAISALRRLPDKTLVCLAGVVLEQAASISIQQSLKDGDEFEVSNAWIRNGTECIRLCCYRDLAPLALDLVVRSVVFIESVAKHYSEDRGLEVVAVPDQLATMINACSPPTMNDCSSVSIIAESISSEEREAHRDYENEDAEWTSLSVIAAVANCKEQREIKTLYQVPSIFLTVDDSLTYQGCSKCKKGCKQIDAMESPQPACSCGAEMKSYWRGKIMCTDASGDVFLADNVFILC